MEEERVLIPVQQDIIDFDGHRVVYTLHNRIIP
jgi:hypothetical protein